MPSEGFRLAQLDTAFLADDKFRRLRRALPDQLTFMAAVGLWACALADAWGHDRADVTAAILADDPAELAAALRAAGLLNGSGERYNLTSYGDWSAKVRHRRAADAERQRRHREKEGPDDPASQ